MQTTLNSALLTAVAASHSAHAADALPSWNDGRAKRSIVEFVEKVTQAGDPNFVPLPERIAVFDNDGTLWAEQPAYTQAYFAIDRIRLLAPSHPEWKTTEPYASAVRGDLKAVMARSETELLELVMATHAGMTTTEFEKIVTAWLAKARHPKTGRPFTEMVYQPMLELLSYLRANGFKTYIVSGGGIEFMRPWTEKVYGIPPEQVIGSTGELRYEVRNGTPVLVKLPKLVLIDDNEGKPVGIQRHIGRQPVMAFGNSDGDLPMLQWTCSAPGARFCLYVHHTDAVREYAYDRKSNIGKLDKGLDEAAARRWTVVDMKADWNKIFPATSR